MVKLYDKIKFWLELPKFKLLILFENEDWEMKTKNVLESIEYLKRENNNKIEIEQLKTEIIENLPKINKKNKFHSKFYSGVGEKFFLDRDHNNVQLINTSFNT